MIPPQMVNLAQSLKTASDPWGFLMNMAKSDPKMWQYYQQNILGKTPQEIEQAAKEEIRKSGFDPQQSIAQVRQQLGI